MNGMRRTRVYGAALFALCLAFPASVPALDPPHDATSGIECITCHTAHGAAGGALNVVDGNANLCLTCHTPAGQAAERPFAVVDAAQPPLPNPSGWSVGRGTSHRWDSGPSGHLLPVSGNTSPGRIASGGTFSGRIEERYTITIVAAGSAGAATFAWTSLRDGSGSGVSGTDVAVGSLGLTLTFADGAPAPSFKAGDQWTLEARTDLRLPVTTAGSFERPLGQRVMRERVTIPGTASSVAIGGLKTVCSTCHDQHSQQNAPFDASAPAFTGPGSGWTATGVGRHFQRQPNDANQMCKICHSARDVQSSTQGSHPVGVLLPAGNFQTPASLPLSVAGNVECMSCHAPHFQTSGGANAGQGDGFLLRQSTNDLCFQCHTNADRAGGSHFNPVTGALWGGSKDLTGGTQFPPHTADKRGACVNCHWPHGWPDRANPAQDYPKLWVERYDTDRTGNSDGANGERLCFACHTSQASTALGPRPANPATSNIEAEFARGAPLASATGDVFRHPVNDTEQQIGPAGRRVVECVDCHNPHRATAADRHAGVAGVDLAGSAVPAGSRPLAQQEVCFKCHGDGYNAARPMTSNKRLDFAAGNSAYHPVTQAGRNQSANLANQLLGGLTTGTTIRCTDCHNSDAFAATTGKIVDSAAVTVGAHGSAFAPILRANFNRNYTSGPTNFAAANFNLCFRCHDAAKLVTARRTPEASTNFYDTINGKDNLHWVHLVDRAGNARATCQNCHFDIHSNISAANTQYRVNNTLYADNAAVSAAKFKTHMVNFSPDIAAIGGRAKPEWWLNTATRERRCYVACHGTTMNGEQYRPASGGDETIWTYP